MFKNRGFTLIEVMIVVAICTIFGAVALSAYKHKVCKEDLNVCKFEDFGTWKKLTANMALNDKSAMVKSTINSELIKDLRDEIAIYKERARTIEYMTQTKANAEAEVEIQRANLREAKLDQAQSLYNARLEARKHGLYITEPAYANDYNLVNKSNIVKFRKAVMKKDGNGIIYSCIGKKCYELGE